MSGAPDGHGAVGVVLEVGLALAGAAIAVSAPTGGCVGQRSICEGCSYGRGTHHDKGHCTPLHTTESHDCSHT